MSFKTMSATQYPRRGAWKLLSKFYNQTFDLLQMFSSLQCSHSQPTIRTYHYISPRKKRDEVE